MVLRNYLFTTLCKYTINIKTFIFILRYYSMDLNLDNYSLDELKNILQISKKDKTFPDMAEVFIE